MKLVSIIIPIYNSEKYLRRCIESALNQTYSNIEIVAINDGSTDKSRDILTEYSMKDKRIKPINIGNKGVSAVRNIGIEQATGDYIFFLDSDDFIKNDLIANLSNYMEKDYDLIKYKTIYVDENENEMERIDGPIFEEKNGEDAFNIMYDKDTMLQVPWLYLYKKNLFTDNNITYPEGKVHEDFARTILIMLKAKKMCSVNIYGYYYRKTQKSITRGNEEERIFEKSMDIIEHYDYIVKKIKEYNLNDITTDNVKCYYANCVILEAENLSGNYRKKYVRELKLRQVYKNIKIKNIKQLIKRILLSININLYLKLR